MCLTGFSQAALSRPALREALAWRTDESFHRRGDLIRREVRM